MGAADTGALVRQPAYNVREFLDEVGRVVSGDFPGPSVNTTTAVVRKRPDSAFEHRDTYGQFVNTVLTAREPASIVAALAARIEAG
ncbi:hypothetical protein ACH5AL_30910 [Actinacidiphila glaucinigra]|uniref:hypothetical protein n=1 Tax=Actinacidiphila glaucinigra TaxID=235986 RepID=UPI0037BBFC49